MNLQEEYFSRHLIDAPVIKYVKEGYLILKRTIASNNIVNWVIFSICELPQNNHPNNITLSEMVPVYNSFNNSNQFVITPYTVTMDDYKDCILQRLSYAHGNGYKPVFGDGAAKLAAMEMFVFIWCSYLLDVYKHEILRDYYIIIEKNKSIQDRLAAFERLEYRFLGDPSALSESWRRFKKYILPDLYCNWLSSWK